MKYFIYIIIIIFLIKIYDKLYLKLQILKVIKKKRISHVSYENYIDINRHVDLYTENFEISSNFVKEKMDGLILLPNNYDKNKKYPCLYLLHGLRDDCKSWIDKAKLGEIYYELLENKEITEMILILPNSGFNGRSWYTNWLSEEKRAYENYFIKELMPYIDKKFNINSRAIGGFSMGGYGAFKLALKNLNSFTSVSSLAGAINFPRFFFPELKGLGIFKHLSINRLMTKSEDSMHLAYIFGKKMKAFRQENVYNILRKAKKNNFEDLKKLKFFLSVGDKDNTFYTMLYQWIDIVGELDKRKLSYYGHLVKNEEHTWAYVEKELRSVLKFHSDKFKGV